MRPLTCLMLSFALTSCTLIPSSEYMESDSLDHDMPKDKMVGVYKPTNNAIRKLSKHYSTADIDRLKSSRIIIYSGGDSIRTFSIPIKSDTSNIYYLLSTIDRLDKRDSNEKFWDIRQYHSYWPDMKFRLKNGIPSVLVNLGIDPDDLEYYDYKMDK